MKKRSLILIFAAPFILIAHSTLFAQTTSAPLYKSYQVLKDKVTIHLSEGELNISPLSDKAVRIQFEKDLPKEDKEFILVNTLPIPQFKVSETTSKLNIATRAVSVIFDKQTGAIDFSNAQGSIFLREKPGARQLTDNTVMGHPCYIAGQTFDSPAGEYLFGLGQFQDGNFNLKDISRKLIQVNTQIAIPFIYSSRGFGLLWHQYGLTWFNPADSLIALTKKDSAGTTVRDAEVTTTAGTQKVSQRQSLYTGKFNVEKDGIYTLMLDLGNMDNRHLLIIDDTPYIDQSNLWLPPAASKLISLKAGEHKVQVVCKSSNTPTLSWKATENTTTFRSPNAKSLDYTVFYGKDADEVIAGYRNLSGKVPMLPLWAYGFWQCRERYTSGANLVETINEFRARRIPVDVIVQDWQYWGKWGWGIPKFDETHYPNPEQFIAQLHGLHAHFSISVWENLDRKSEVAKDYVSQNLYIPNSPWIDIYNPATQKTHWKTLNENLFSKGVDSWWMDATEPENDALTGKETYFGPGDFYRLTYPLFVSKAIYEGQRNTNPNKRVTILTRSAYPGQQRYGTINWSGDIGGNWDSYKRQIVAGLNYNITGMPYWTTDIGGFFRPGRGQYTDDKYRDLLIRWFQWGTFNPIFRVHGYQSETEPWKYGDTTEAAIRTMLDLRYRLIPYIYSEAWQVSKNNSTLMRPLVMDFPKDRKAIGQPYQYMFGKDLLITPITEPDISEWNVYLPVSAGWYDFWTGRRYDGGQTIRAAAPQDKIPVFVKAGSILPMGKFIQYTDEKPSDTVEIRIYPGADGACNLYEDEGDGYNYEKGNYTVIPFKWNEKDRLLTIGAIQGAYPGNLKQRVFNIVMVSKMRGFGIAAGELKNSVTYTGKMLTVPAKK
jgi:alpha-D-xyloside xylohydrolase